jgi:hypothetical protein
VEELGVVDWMEVGEELGVVDWPPEPQEEADLLGLQGGSGR